MYVSQSVKPSSDFGIQKEAWTNIDTQFYNFGN